MRLFIAIDLDDDGRQAIAAEQARIAKALRTRGVTLRPVPAHQLHLTLAFLGEVPEQAVPAVGRALAAPIDRQPFPIVFGGLGMFPPRGAPRVLWIGLQAGAAAVTAVQREVAERVTHAGAVLEDRAFAPHLTIARWRDARPSDRSVVLSMDSGRPIATVQVNAVALYKSALTADGAIHTVLARAALR